jgi:hypothetical protein
LSRKREAELKKIERISLKHPLRGVHIPLREERLCIKQGIVVEYFACRGGISIGTSDFECKQSILLQVCSRINSISVTLTE